MKVRLSGLKIKVTPLTKYKGRKHKSYEIKGKENKEVHQKSSD